MLEKGKTIGILGGGQLARMLAVAAPRIGYRTHIYDQDPDSPASEIASCCTIGSFHDKALLQKFAKSIDVATYEFENIPNSAIAEIEKNVQIFPKKNALAISQDRIQEKKFFRKLNLKTVEYEIVSSFENFSTAITKLKAPSILKTCRDGYDGKGQLLITKDTKKDEVENHLLNGPCILESFLNFEKELSVIIARTESGDVVSFDPGENIHKSGILHTTTVPTKISKPIQIDAIIIAGKIINALNYVGVLGVELFITFNGEIIVNEIAPRVHNSGHWTQNGCVIDQFEQHIRAISGRRLGDGERHSDVTMINILGEAINDSLNITDGAIHLYGKKDIRDGRKMGHINYVSQKSS